jgi:RNA polymerase sigma factor (sigma-70 family)
MEPPVRPSDENAPAHSSAPDLQSKHVWDELLESIGAAGLLVVIESRMNALLRSKHHPEDVLQEVLCRAWRDRQRFEWRGQRSFRNWLLTISDRWLEDLTQHEAAQKRGGGASVLFSDALSGDDPSEPSSPDPGFHTTTPGRLAVLREQREVMQRALADLPDSEREVVRLRLFEDRTADEAARILDLGVDAVRHRFRVGLARYRRLLARANGENEPRSEQVSPRDGAKRGV